MELEPRAEEPKLNCLPELKLQIGAPAWLRFLSVYHRLEETVRYIKKFMVGEEVDVNCYIFNPIFSQ